MAELEWIADLQWSPYGSLYASDIMGKPSNSGNHIHLGMAVSGSSLRRLRGRAARSQANLSQPDLLMSFRLGWSTPNTSRKVPC